MSEREPEPRLFKEDAPFFRPLHPNIQRRVFRVAHPSRMASPIAPACTPESGCAECYPAEHAYAGERAPAHEVQPTSATHAHFCPACLEPWTHVEPACGVTTRASAWIKSFSPSALFVGGEALCPEHAWGVGEEA